MQHLTKDILRVQRSTANSAKRCEILMAKNLTLPRRDITELREKYNLIEFV